MAALTVSALNRAVATSLERSFPLVCVRGEVAQFTKAASGHWYFSLRDELASVKAVMFKGRSALMDWIPKEGDQVEVNATVSLYEPRGDFQLRIESMARFGQGALYEAFLARKEKLSKEGLLDDARKRSLPSSINTIGLVTSLSGAVLRDVVVTLTRNAPRIRIRLYPSLVQGAEAPAMLMGALASADADDLVDVLMLVRGGGSLEDLWSFNDEALARKIAGLKKVIVVGVGHETDVTLADLVADIRAATPTAAAQLISAQDIQKMSHLSEMALRGRHGVGRRWQMAQQRLDLLAQKLKSPRESWQLRAQRLQAMRAGFAHAMTRQMQSYHVRIAGLSGGLAALDPTAILQRGYAIATDAQGEPVTDASKVAPRQALSLRLAKGLLDVRVERSQSDPGGG